MSIHTFRPDPDTPDYCLCGGGKFNSEHGLLDFDALPLLYAAAQAALKYDEAIRKRVATGERWVADDELDDLYLDWVTKAQMAVACAEGKP